MSSKNQQLSLLKNQRLKATPAPLTANPISTVNLPEGALTVVLSRIGTEMVWHLEGDPQLTERLWWDLTARNVKVKINVTEMEIERL